MKFVIRDNIQLGVALVVAMTSCAWFALHRDADAGANEELVPHSNHGGAIALVGLDRRGPKVDAPAQDVPSAGQTARGDQAGPRDDPNDVMRQWNAPQPKAPGDPWIFDLFTPPEIRYDDRTRRFAVSTRAAPRSDAPKAGAVTPKLRLRAVRRSRFRLQLVGYATDATGARGFFETTATSEIFVAGRGGLLPGSRLRVAEFAVARQPYAGIEGIATAQEIATAVILDEETGETTVLASNEPCFAGPVVATLESFLGDPESIEVHAGDIVPVGGARYRVEKIRLDPPTVDLIRRDADAVGIEHLSLSPQPLTP